MWKCFLPVSCFSRYPLNTHGGMQRCAGCQSPFAALATSCILTLSALMTSL